MWATWHLPLFFIQGYPLFEYTHDALKMFVYFTDLVPKAIIYTYVFYTNRRSTFAAMLFHFMGNLTGSIIEIDPVTECIQLVLLSIIAVALVFMNKKIYFQKHICHIKQGIIQFIS